MGISPRLVRRGREEKPFFRIHTPSAPRPPPHASISTQLPVTHPEHTPDVVTNDSRPVESRSPAVVCLLSLSARYFSAPHVSSLTQQNRPPVQQRSDARNKHESVFFSIPECAHAGPPRV